MGSGSVRLRSSAARISAIVCTCRRATTGPRRMSCSNAGERPCGRLLNACIHRATGMVMEEQTLLIPSNCLHSSVWLSLQKMRTMEDGEGQIGRCKLLDVAVLSCLLTWQLSQEKALCLHWYTGTRSGWYPMILIHSRRYLASWLLTAGAGFLSATRFHFPFQVKAKQSSERPDPQTRKQCL